MRARSRTCEGRPRGASGQTAPNAARQRGLTLLESLLAAVVLAMAVAAVIMPFTAGAQATAEDARRTLAVNVAQDLMEEILTKPFHDPDGTEVGETGRSSWDDVADYDGYSEQEGAITSFDGGTVDDPAALGLTRQATVEGVYLSGQDALEPPTFYRVCVYVRYHDHAIVNLARLVYANE